MVRTLRALLTVVSLVLAAVFVAATITGDLPWYVTLVLVGFLVVHRALWSVRLNA